MDSHTATPSASPTLETGKKFVLLFSGGLDSTLEVVERMKTHREAHLLTFNNGYCINTKGGIRRASEMKDRFGTDRIIDSLINTKPLMQTILGDFKALWREYRSPLIVDMGCKMASVTELILYAKENGIEEISDGASVDQTQVFIQHPEFSAHIKPLISAHGLRFLRPILFDMSREEKMAKLKTLGFDRGSKTLEKLHITSQLKHQPFCLVGFSTFFFTSP
ncbi:MAG: hypothetical protein KAJ78_09470, partial [Acidobacteria bacterium]|nr:hypothetical protein [Acidobacteriota bacterium]